MVRCQDFQPQPYPVTDIEGRVRKTLEERAKQDSKVAGFGEGICARQKYMGGLIVRKQSRAIIIQDACVLRAKAIDDTCARCKSWIQGINIKTYVERSRTNHFTNVIHKRR
jgi:hypothetical protein